MHLKKISLLAMTAIMFALLSCSTGDLVKEYVLIQGMYPAGGHTIEVSLRDANDVPFPEGYYLWQLQAGQFEDFAWAMISSIDYNYDPLDEIHYAVYEYGSTAKIAFDLPEESYITLKFVQYPGPPVAIVNVD